MGTLCGGDCDDNDASIYPGASETPYDGIDQDCGGANLTDFDEDEYVAVAAAGDDCNDDDASIHPGASDVCDGVDNNCDGQVDEGLPTSTYYLDGENDGYGDPTNFIHACSLPSGYPAQ